MEKIALVTGANRGIGLESCRQLAQRGFRVVLTSRDPALGEEAADGLRQEGLEIATHQLDVTIPEQVTRVRDWVLGEFGRLEVLINNAGIFLDEHENIFEVTEPVFQETLEVNLYGALRVTRAFMPAMLEQNYGRVVNVSSAGGSLSAMGSLAGRMGAY